MTFTPTEEQAIAVELASTTEDNLLISALAGAAKTSTLVLIAEALPTTRMLCLAFNKAIQLEMQERLPSNCKAMTLNGLGHRAWSEAIGKFCKLDKDKVYNLLKEKVDALEGEEKTIIYENFADIKRNISSLKSAGWLPEGKFDRAKPLMSDSEAYDWLSEEPSELEWKLIYDVSLESAQLALKGRIDFDDQILMPTLFPCIFERYPLVLIDEAQDLSALNHAMLRKIARRRLIAVGDECQAIYGFRGAHQNSMQLLEKEFEMKRIGLTISFRCSQKVVEHARWRAPAMRYPEWAKAGSVANLTVWSVEDLPDTATIICRNNAPLFDMAIKLLRNGRYPQIRGNDIGKTLLKQMKKLGPDTMPRAQLIEAILQWRDKKLEKSRDPGKIEDQAACMRVFAEQGDDLSGAILYAEHVFNAHGPLQLMTGHKSKGLEFDDVFILDRQLLSKHGQDLNLLYVMQTRAKLNLTYITSEGFTHD